MANDLVFDYPNSGHASPDATPPASAPLVDEMTKAATAEAARAKAEADAAKARLAPAPEAVKEIRASDERRMFGESAAREIGGVLREEMDVDLVLSNTPEAEREAIYQATAEIALDVGLSVADVKDFIRFAAEPRDARARAEEAIDSLKRAYGRDAQQAWADANRLAERDPRFLAILKSAKLADHPKVIMRLAELARSAKAAGRLK